MPEAPPLPPPSARLPPGVLAVRPGPGANCSSIGSVIDILFVAGMTAGAVAAALAAALPTEPEAGPEAPPPEPPPGDSTGERTPAGHAGAMLGP
jgi:hypothetical protein